MIRINRFNYSDFYKAEQFFVYFVKYVYGHLYSGYINVQYKFVLYRTYTYAVEHANDYVFLHWKAVSVGTVREYTYVRT